MEGRQRGVALDRPEIQLAAHLDLAAGGEVAVVAHIGKSRGAQDAGRWIGGGCELTVQTGFGRDVPHQADAPGGGAVAARIAGRVGGRDFAAVGQVQLDTLVAQRRHQVEAGRERGAVLRIHGHGAHLVVAVWPEARPDAGNVKEALGFKPIGIDGAHRSGKAVRETGLLVAAHVQAKRPVAALASKLALVGAVDPVAHHALVMALQQRVRTHHRRVGAVEHIGLHVAVVAQGVVRIQRVLELQAVADFPVGDGAQPVHALGVDAVRAVVILETRGFVDAQSALHRVEERCAPVRAVDLLVLKFVGQCVTHPTAQVREQRCGQLRGLAVRAFGPGAAPAVIEVEPQVVIATAIAVPGNAAIEADGSLREAVAAQPHLRFAEAVPHRQLGDVVDGAAHRTRTVQKTRWPADHFHAVVDPAVHRACRDGVLHVDAVEQLRKRGAAKTPVLHANAARRIVRRHTGHSAQRLLCVLCTARVDGGAVHHGEGGWRLTRRQAEAAAGLDRYVQLQAPVGLFLCTTNIDSRKTACAVRCSLSQR